MLFVNLLVVSYIAFDVVFNSTCGMFQASEGYFGDKTFTFVHGSLESRMNFTNARNYCLNLAKKGNTTSNLASVQNLKVSKILVRWILSLERRSFWIGGEIICSMNALLEKMHLLHWVDNEKVAFTNFKMPNLNAQKMKVGDKLCVSVDHLDGKWGVHNCSEKKFFLCITKPEIKKEKATTELRYLTNESSLPLAKNYSNNAVS